MNKEILSKKEKLFMYLIGTFQSSAWIALGKAENPMTEKTNVNIKSKLRSVSCHPHVI